MRPPPCRPNFPSNRSPHSALCSTAARSHRGRSSMPVSRASARSMRISMRSSMSTSTMRARWPTRPTSNAAPVCARGPLHGLPIALKDLLHIEGRQTTAGSKSWLGRRSDDTATTVSTRLLAAGMIPLGKTHMVEFAFGGWGRNAPMGAPWNPWDRSDASRCRRVVERVRGRRRWRSRAGGDRLGHRRLHPHSRRDCAA